MTITSEQEMEVRVQHRQGPVPTEQQIAEAEQQVAEQEVVYDEIIAQR